MLCQIIACDNIQQAKIANLVLDCKENIDYGTHYLVYKNVAYQMLPTFVIPHKIPHCNFHIPMIDEDIINKEVMIIPKTQWKGTIRTF